MTDWRSHVEREISRYQDGEARLPDAIDDDDRQRQLTRMGNAAGGAGLALLMVGVFLRGNSTERIAWLSVLALIVTGALLLWAPPAGTRMAFEGLYVVDQFARFLAP